MSTIIFQLQSTLIIALMLWGIKQAKTHRLKHRKLMSLAMLWDLLLIVQIEVVRHAVEKVISIEDNTRWLNIHVSLAVATVLLYPFMYQLGKAIMNGKQHLAPTHKKLGLLTLSLRLLTYGTSFLVI